MLNQGLEFNFFLIQESGVLIFEQTIPFFLRMRHYGNLMDQ